MLTICKVYIEAFLAGSQFSNDSSLALMRIMVDKKEAYPLKKDSLDWWKGISRDLYAKKKYVYTAEKCQSHVKTLIKEYKGYQSEAARTGAPGPMVLIPCELTREIMRLTAELTARIPSVHPTYVLGAGVDLVEYGVQVSEGRSQCWLCL